MDSFEWNKVLGGVLGTALFVLAVRAASQLIYAAPEPEKPAFAVAAAPAPAAPAPTTTQAAPAAAPAAAPPAPAQASNAAPAAPSPAASAPPPANTTVASAAPPPAPPAPPPAPAAPALPDFATVLPAADVMAGASVAERCMVCHDTAKDGTNKIGPLLYGVVGRKRASFPGFEYSPAMKDKGGDWTYAELFQFIEKPLQYIPGTKMGFAGLPRVSDRINLIAYLRMQADMPAPLP